MQNWEEFIFENRNKLYGSYLLRRKYVKYLLIGFIAALALVLIPLFGLNYYYQKKTSAEEMPFTISVDLSHIDMDNLLSEPPPPIKVPEVDVSEKAPVVKDSVKEMKSQERKAQSSIHDSTFKENVEKIAKGNGQNVDNDTSSFYRVDEYPHYIGGEAEFVKFIQKNFVVPEAIVKKRIKGKIVVRIYISKTGDVQNVILLSGIDPSIDNEALRVLRIPRKWQPAKSAGRPIPFYFDIPLVL